MHSTPRYARSLLVLIMGALFFAFGIGQAFAVETPVSLSCPTGGGGDQISRGFYITNFTGDRLDMVTVSYFTEDATSNSTMQLIAHLNTYDGQVLGTASFTGDFTVNRTVVYDFGGVYVPVNSTIAFVQQPVGSPADGFLFYDYGTGSFDPSDNPCPGFFETEDTSAPLSTFRRHSVGVIVTGAFTGVNPASVGFCITLPSGSVVGAMGSATQAFYEPGKAAEGVTINPGTYWVVGTDESGQFYKILLSCDFLWVPVSSMQPSYQAPWSGQPLPTTVVS